MKINEEISPLRNKYNELMNNPRFFDVSDMEEFFGSIPIEKHHVTSILTKLSLFSIYKGKNEKSLFFF